jgi:hypothetical protein
VTKKQENLFSAAVIAKTAAVIAIKESGNIGMAITAENRFFEAEKSVRNRWSFCLKKSLTIIGQEYIIYKAYRRSRN